VDVASAMEELGIERAVLVGNSFGGAVAMRVAAVTPERVAALPRPVQ
jgi:4,5:9,10-diseco-3-hydroxy-5,9,17-trioxoandrosta-1(10),2-diene-4-oate hydrolase